MDRDLVEQKLTEIQNQTMKLIDEAYISGYKDGYFECMNHKGMAMTGAYLIPKEEPKRISLPAGL